MTKSLKINFELVTPERVVLRAELSQISVPTVSGEITILPHHIQLVSLIKAGVIELKKIDGSIEVLSVSGGTLEVLADRVVLLADTAERAAELDENRIKEARHKAESLRQSDRQDFTAVQAMVEKELARHHAIRRWKKLKNIETIN